MQAPGVPPAYRSSLTGLNTHNLNYGTCKLFATTAVSLVKIFHHSFFCFAFVNGADGVVTGINVVSECVGECQLGLQLEDGMLGVGCWVIPILILLLTRYGRLRQLVYLTKQHEKV